MNERDDEKDEPLTVLGVPVRLDATLCDHGEIWLEGPDGHVEKIGWPESPKGSDDGDR